MRRISVLLVVLLATAGIAPTPATAAEATPPSSNVTVTIHENTGAPLESGSVRASGSGYETATVSGGEASLALADGDWWVQWRDGDRYSESVQVAVTDGLAAPSTVDLVVPPVNLAVTVVHGDGTAAATARVTADGPKYVSSNGSDHSFALVDGTWELRAQEGASVAAPATVEVADGVATPAELVMTLQSENVTVTYEPRDGLQRDVDIEINGPVFKRLDGPGPHSVGLPDGNYEARAINQGAGVRLRATAAIEVVDGTATPSTLVLTEDEPNVTVRVVGPDGAPVTSGVVNASSWGNVREPVNDGLAHFRLDDGDWTLRWNDGERASSAADVTVTDGAAATPEITLTAPDENLQVTLANADGTPVADGDVRARSDEGINVSSNAEPHSLALPDGRWTISASADGAEAAPTTVEVVNGVTDASPLEMIIPVDNLTVSYEPRDDVARDVRIEADGPVGLSRFGAGPHTLALPNGTYTLRARDNHSYGVRAEATVEVVDGVATPDVLILTEAEPNVTVRVVEADGTPLDSGIVRAYGPGSSRETVHAGLAHLRLADGDWTVRWQDGDRVTAAVAVAVSDGTATTPEITLAVPDENLDVTLVHPDGTPVATGTVRARSDEGINVSSNAERHSLALPDGRWTISASADGAEAAPATVEVVNGVADASPLEMIIPVDNLTVSYEPRDGVARDVRIGVDGPVGFSRSGAGPHTLALPDGTYTLRARDNNTYGVRAEATVEVVDGVASRDVLILTEAEPNVTVRVVDANGTPLDSGIVRAYGPGSPGEIVHAGLAYLRLDDGDWTVRWQDGNRATAAADVTVTDGAAATPDITLTVPAINLRPVVVDADGNPVNDANVVVHRRDAQGAYHHGLFGELRAVASPYEFGLPDGSWEVQAAADDRRSAPMRIDVAAGSATDVAPRLVLPSENLTVTYDPRDGVARDVRVSVQGPIATSRYGAGPHTFALPDGSYHVTVASDHRARAQAQVEVVDGSATPSSIVLTEPEPNVTVQVVDSAGAPVDDGRITVTGTDHLEDDVHAGTASFRLADGNWALRWAGGNKASQSVVVRVRDGVAVQSTVELVAPDDNLQVDLQYPDGAAVPNGHVTVQDQYDWRRFESGAAPHVFGLPDGTYVVTGNDGRHRSQRRTVRVAGGVANTPILVVVVPRPNLRVTYDGAAEADDVDIVVERYDVQGAHIADGREFALGDGTYTVSAYERWGDSSARLAWSEVEVTDGVAVPSELVLADAPKNLTVDVTDDNDDGVGEGELVVRREPYQWQGDAFGSADADGSHELALPDGTWTVEWRDELRGRQVEPATVTVIDGVASPSSLAFAVPATNIVVEVVDSDGNAVDARVLASRVGSDWFESGWSGGAPYHLVDGEWHVLARSEDDSSRVSEPVRVSVVDGVASPSRLEIELPSHPLTVTMTTSDGRALDRLDVEAVTIDRRRRVTGTYDDEDAVLYLADGTWDVRVNGLLAGRVEVVDGVPERDRLDVAQPAPTVRVEVIDPAERITEVEVGASLAGTNSTGGSVRLWQEGLVAGLLLPDGKWEISGFDTHRYEDIGTATVEVVDGTADRELVTLGRPPENFEVEILDTDGTPTIGGSVTAESGDDQRRASAVHPLQLPDGDWTVYGQHEGATVGVAIVQVSDGVAVPARATFTRPPRNLTVTATGLAFDRLHVTSRPVDSRNPRLTQDQHIATDSSATFALPDGRWSVSGANWAGDDEFVTEDVEVEVVDGVATPSEVDLRPVDANLQVTVREPDGSILPVRVSAHSGDRYVEMSSDGTADVPLPDGTWDVEVDTSTPDSIATTHTVVVTDGRAVPSVIEYALEPPNLTVSIRREDGAPTEGWFQVRFPEDGPYTGEYFSTSAGDGAVHLPDGTHVVTVTAPGSMPSRTEVVVSDGTADPSTIHALVPDVNTPIVAYGVDGGFLGSYSIRVEDTAGTERWRTSPRYRENAVALPDGRWRLFLDDHREGVSPGVDVVVTDGIPTPSTIVLGNGPDDEAPSFEVLDRPEARTTSRSATVTFDVEDDALVTCTLDGDMLEGRCTSPLQLDRLSVGQHVLSLVASDGAGNATPPAAVEWTVEAARTGGGTGGGSSGGGSAGGGGGSTPPSTPDGGTDQPEQPTVEPAPTGGDNEGPGDGADTSPPTSSPTEPKRRTPAPEPTPVFGDVDPDSTFAEDIQALAESGVTRGCNPPANTRFCPDFLVTRGEMAAFLTRALGLERQLVAFKDVGRDEIFRRDIGALKTAGITLGCNPPVNDRYCPDRAVTRGEMAALLVRALSLPEGDARFRDVRENNSFRRPIAALASAGITRGCNPPANDRFCPDSFVTREELAAFLNRAGLLGRSG